MAQAPQARLPAAASAARRLPGAGRSEPLIPRSRRAFGLPVLAFLAAVFLRLASSAASTFFSISVIEPPAFSTAALADAVA